jgi:hypothetical protein
MHFFLDVLRYPPEPFAIAVLLQDAAHEQFERTTWQLSSRNFALIAKERNEKTIGLEKGSTNQTDRLHTFPVVCP